MMALTLHPYQKEAVKATVEHFRRHSTPTLIALPTSAGKSLVIAELVRQARERTDKVVFGSVQSVARNLAAFTTPFRC